MWSELSWSSHFSRSYSWALMYCLPTREPLRGGLILCLSTGFRKSKLETLGTVCLTLRPHSSWSSLLLEQVHVTGSPLRLQSEFTPAHLCPPPGWARRWAALTHNTQWGRFKRMEQSTGMWRSQVEAQTVGRDDLESPSVEGFFSFVLSYFFYCGCLAS